VISLTNKSKYRINLESKRRKAYLFPGLHQEMIKYNKIRQKIKPPTYADEFCFVTVTLFFLKLYSQEAFMALSFFTICIPIMLYQVISLFGNLLKFIKMMHIEDEKASTDETSLFGILS
jgi:hypothetical protein